jgi:PhnB protein
MLVQPYLNFAGRCEEAIDFYREALGAEVIDLMRNEDSPEPLPADRVPPGSERQVLHAAFRIGETTVMATDGCGVGDGEFTGISLSITVPDTDAADRTFAALSEGGEVGMPLDKTFWSPRFGMVKDRFGVHWMVNTYSEESP